MNYRKIRELLLYEKVLSTEDAMLILYSWMEDAELYNRFLSEGCAVNLAVYSDYSVEKMCHVFEPSDVFVLAPCFAQKFFNVKNDAVNALLATIVNQLAFNEENAGEIYAWPYLTMDCVKNLNVAFLLNVIEDVHFIFDFAEDTKADIYNCLYSKLYEANECDTLLPINSFNLSPRWLHRKSDYSVETLMQNFFMVNCGFGQGIPDAAMRKLFINYFMRCSRQIEDGMQQYLSQNN